MTSDKPARVWWIDPQEHSGRYAKPSGRFAAWKPERVPQASWTRRMIIVVEKSALDAALAEIEQLNLDLGNLRADYNDRGVAMRETGKMVRSMYAPKNVKLNKENGRLRGQIDELKAKLNATDDMLKHSERKVSELKAEIERLNKECISLFLHEQRVSELKAYKVAAIAELTKFREENEKLKSNNLLEAVFAADEKLRAERDKLREENTKLKAELWVAKDSALRTYDGLTTRHDRYKEALERIADRNAHGVMVTIARRALEGAE